MVYYGAPMSELVHQDARKSSTLGPAFSSLLAGTCVSNLGDGLRLAAIPVLATTLTTSPALITGLAAAQYLPWAVFAPFGGVIVDRSDRRRLILVTQVWRSLVMCMLALAVVTNVVEVWHLFVVAFVITVGEILVDPSVVATVPTLVSPAQLDRANGQITTAEVVTNQFAGGPIGAISFGFAPWLPFLLDSVSYLGSTGPFSRLPSTKKTIPKSAKTGQPVSAEMAEGLRWIWGHQFLRPLTLAVAVFHLGTAGAASLLVLVVKDVLDASDVLFGFVLASAAVGAALGSLVAARLSDRFSRQTTVSASTLLTACSVLASSMVVEEWQLVLSWMANGAGGSVSLSIGRGFIQRHTPNDRLGRTAIASRMITRSAFVVGALLVGLVAERLSIRWALRFAGCFHLAGSALLWRSFRHEPVQP